MDDNSAPPDIADLEVACVTELPATVRGGTAVVLLHGWQAPGDELVGLAKTLLTPGSRMFVPVAPLAEPDGGRAWWRLDPDNRPAWAWEDRPPAGHRPNPGVTAARLAVQRLLAEVRERHAPDSVAVVGFSQGAMLALDLGVRAGSGIDKVAVLSGVMLADSLAAMGGGADGTDGTDGTVAHGGTRFLLTHGLDDDELPFQAAEKARELLEQNGRDVTWAPLPGGHSITTQAVAALRSFLTA